MLLSLEPDQEFFRDTTARFLDETAPPVEIRRLHRDPSGFDETYWQRGAELGWTLLLVDEDHGGGSISQHGLVDLTLVAHEFGRHAAPGPLLVTNIVASALAHAGGDAHADVLAGILDGSTVASWCYAERRPHQRLGDIALTVRPEGDELVLDGVKRPVESANRASHLLVCGRTGDRLTQVVVPVDTPGITRRDLDSVDLTRRFSEVRFDGVRVPASSLVGEVGGADEQVEQQLRVALVVCAAEMVGAMQVAFDMTVEYAFHRYSFGRPLASYQALKHRFADMKMVLEGSHAIADAAAAAVAAGDPDAGEVASAAKAYAGDTGTTLMHECVQLHGGIGVTYEHDLHLYLRRHAIDRTLYGTPTEHRQRIAVLVDQREAA
jgi:alkylation response protein AidB-like acyl-CoA dehydrogenase